MSIKLTRSLGDFNDAWKISENDFKWLFEAFPEGVIAFDLETTGLSPLVDKIIEIGAVKITPKGNTVFQTLLDPEIEIPQYTIDIHGITNDMVKGQPLEVEALNSFVEFCGELPLIAHNAQFDIGFIVFALRKNQINFKDNRVYCSCKFAREALKVESYKLSSLSEKLGITLENHHRASDDAFACLKIFAESLGKQIETKSSIYLKPGLMYTLSSFQENAEFKIPQHLEGIKNHLAEKNTIAILYNGGSHRGKFRPVRPISFLPLPHGNILYAHCLLDDLYKSFKVERISKFRELTDEDTETWNLKDNSFIDKV